MRCNLFPTTRKTLAALVTCIAFLLPLELGKGAIAAVAFDGQVQNFQQKTIYHSPEKPGYTSWVGLWQLPNGTIQCDFSQATGPTDKPVLSYPVLQTTDAGKTWTRVSANVPTGYSRGMAVLSNGVLVRPAETQTFEPYDLCPAGGIIHRAEQMFGVQRSTDGGATWSQAIDLVSVNDYQLCWTTVVKPLRDGRLVAMAGLVPTNTRQEREQASIVKTMFISSDQGKTWGSPIPLIPASVGACEESDFVELPNGDLFWMHRAQQWGSDGSFGSQSRVQNILRRSGETFVAESPTMPFAGGQGFPCELLTREGILLDLDFTGSHWSNDGGQTWHNLMIGGQQFRTPYYPQAVQAADGTIVVLGHDGMDNVYGTVDQSILMQTFRVSEVPEPSGISMLGIGIATVFAYLLYPWSVHWTS